ncbi:hypothetical protein ACFWM3_23965 [Gottfriedia sp. NPDC058432]
MQDITNNFTLKAEIDTYSGLKEEVETCGIGHSYEAEINVWNALLQSRK